MLNDFFVDDFLSGGQKAEEFGKLISQLTLLMKRDIINLRKWTSNVPGVLKNVSGECR